MDIKNAPKTPIDHTIDAYWRDVADANGKEIYETVMKEVERALQDDTYKNKDFYVALFMNRHRNKLEAPMRAFARLSCPGAFYSMAVWKYHHKPGTLEFFWIIPAKAMAKYLAYSWPNVEPHYNALAYYSFMALTGQILEFAKKENGNKKDAIISFTDQDTSHLPVYH